MHIARPGGLYALWYNGFVIVSIGSLMKNNKKLHYGEELQRVPALFPALYTLALPCGHLGVVIMPFKVIQGHRFWYQSKAHMRLLISE